MPNATVTPVTGQQVSSALSTAISAAYKQLGQRYVWGGESRAEGGFDCSGLVQYAFGQAGIKLPRVAADQQRVTTPVSDPRPGDLVFYGRPAYHVGIYLGGGKMLAAPKPGDVVKVQAVYGRPANYGRVTGSAELGTTGNEPANDWAKYLGSGVIAGLPLDPWTKAKLIGGVAEGDGVLDTAKAGALSMVSAATTLAKASAWMGNPHNWVRVAQVTVGGALVLVGVSIVAKPIAAPVADAAGSAAAILPAGKALKAAAAGKTAAGPGKGGKAS